MTFFHYLAQLDADTGKILLTYGPLGFITAWFMFRGERLANNVVTEIRELSHRIDGITRAMLADVISRDTSGEKTKELARSMLAKIEAREEEPSRR